MAPFPQSNKQLEGGTLSQLRNLINRRNVVTKVARDCHVLDTAMKHLGMTTVDSRLSSLPRLIHLWSADRKKYLRLQTVGTIINHLYYCLYLRL
jgi:hypothetical protein